MIKKLYKLTKSGEFFVGEIDFVKLTGWASLVKKRENIKLEKPAPPTDRFPEDKYYSEYYRFLSAGYIADYYLDIAEEVLKSAVDMWDKKPVQLDHNLDVEANVGITSSPVWDETTEPKGINGWVHIDKVRDASKGYAISRGLEMGTINSTSVYFSFEWEKSHPKLSDADFWELCGQEVDGKIVSIKVSKINDVLEQTICLYGADPNARRIEMSKLQNAWELNPEGVETAQNAIDAGAIDTGEWDNAIAEEKLLGDPPDWGKFGRWHLGKTTNEDADPETKAYWSYCFGDGEKVSLAGLRACISAASGARGAEPIPAIADAAQELLEKAKQKIAETGTETEQEEGEDKEPQEASEEKANMRRIFEALGERYSQLRNSELVNNLCAKIRKMRKVYDAKMNELNSRREAGFAQVRLLEKAKVEFSKALIVALQSDQEELVNFAVAELEKKVKEILPIERAGKVPKEVKGNRKKLSDEIEDWKI